MSYDTWGYTIDLVRTLAWPVALVLIAAIIAWACTRGKSGEEDGRAGGKEEQNK